MAAFCKPVNRGGPEGLCFLQLCLSMSLRSKLRICTIALCVRGSAFKCRTLHVLVEFRDLLKLALANPVVLGQCLLHDSLHAIEDILVVGPFCLRLRVAPRTCHAPAASRTRVRFFTALRMTPSQVGARAWAPGPRSEQGRAAALEKPGHPLRRSLHVPRQPAREEQAAPPTRSK